MRSRIFGLLLSASMLGGCSSGSALESSRSHISVANRFDYNVLLSADDSKLTVSLDSKSALGQRLAWAVSFGKTHGPPSSEFDTAATDWLKFEKPEFKAVHGRRTAFEAAEYDVTCDVAPAAR